MDEKTAKEVETEKSRELLIIYHFNHKQTIIEGVENYGLDVFKDREKVFAFYIKNGSKAFINFDHVDFIGWKENYYED